MHQANRRQSFIESGLLATLCLLLLPVEVLCSQASFETLGEIDHFVYWFILICGNSVALLAAVYSRPLGTMSLLLLGLAIIPYQVLLMQRHAEIQVEASRIVAYVYETKLQSGEHPSDLASYTFANPKVKQYIHAYRVGPDRESFTVMYWVGTEGTSHWYSPEDGWSYYPD